MLNEVKRIVSSYGVVTDKKLDLVSKYILGLMTMMKKHSFEAIGKVADCHPSRFSHFMNHPLAVETADGLFNRALRRRLSKIKVQKGETFILFDATFTKRSSRHVENCSTYHSGSGYVKGHKWLNFILVHKGQVIPLASIPLYSKSYCRTHGIKYESEPARVVRWLDDFYSSGFLPPDSIEKIYFLADSGYDTKKIENKILSMGSHFVIALKSSRSVKGLKVSQYFKRHKKSHKTATIRINGSSGKRITFKVRLATGVPLKGVGDINVVCSKGLRGKKETVKYIGTSDSSLKARDIVKYYRARWKIETWHKEVKQKFGFGDCACHRFSAVEAHVLFVLVAYLVHSELKSPAMSIESVISIRLLKKVRVKLNQIGQIGAAQSVVREALQAMAA